MRILINLISERDGKASLNVDTINRWGRFRGMRVSYYHNGSRRIGPYACVQNTTAEVNNGSDDHLQNDGSRAKWRDNFPSSQCVTLVPKERSFHRVIKIYDKEAGIHEMGGIKVIRNGTSTAWSIFLLNFVINHERALSSWVQAACRSPFMIATSFLRVLLKKL